MAEHATREQTGPAKTGCHLRLHWHSRLRQAVREIAQATPALGLHFATESGRAAPVQRLTRKLLQRCCGVSSRGAMRLAQLYLLSYNSAQLAAWACVFVACAAAAQSAPTLPAAAAAAYAASHRIVSACQSVTLLETVHALTGLTRSGVAGNVMQWAGRTHCWFVLTQVAALQSSPATLALLLAWSLSDVVRYSWAALTALGVCPRSLTWLRYTVFVPLYPIGFISELTLLRGGLPAAAAGAIVQPLKLPNALNFSFDYSYFLLFVLLIYPGAWLQLYAHVFRQRAKLFSAGAKKQQ